MMKKYTLLSLLLFFILSTYAQSGWRNGEMEIKVTLNDPSEASRLLNLHLNGDVYQSGYALMYVTPAELDKVKAAGLTFKVTIPDLNSHFKDFWKTREEYHSYDQIIQTMNALSLGYSGICKKVDYGTSYEGRQLTALKISDNVDVDEPEPEVLMDGGIHGDEIGGAENLIRLAEDLCQGYGTDPEITDLIDTREIWLYIMVNPDGRVNMTRYNHNLVDLNRDWGYMWDGWGDSPSAYSQIESKALRTCMYENQFAIYGSYHSGSECFLYAWGYRPDLTPDNAQLDYFGYVYTSTSGYDNLPYGSIYNALYAVNGSTVDAGYGIFGNIAWTVELSYDKQPPTSQILYFYDINRPSMMAAIEYAGYGIHGNIVDAVTSQPVPAIIFIGDYFPNYNDPVVGDYHKYVTAGSYNITVIANGYQAQTKNNIVVNSNTSSTTCNFALQPGIYNYAYRVAGCQIPNNNYGDEGNTPAVLGAPDDVNYSLGKSGWIVIDMQKSILDGPGIEIKVHEGDNSPEGYKCYAGPTIDGPWKFLGNGTGTQSFDFTSAGLAEAQFVKIVDDGDGPATGADAGYDLDAIEVLPQPQIIYFQMDCYADDSKGNGNGRIDPGETVDLVVTLRNHGGLTAENTTGELNFDPAFLTVGDSKAIFGDLAHGDSAQAVFTVSVDPATPVGEILMFVLNVDANDHGFMKSFPFNFTVGTIVEDWETNNFLKFDWSFAGQANWTITPLNPYEGSYSAKSGNINDNETSNLVITMDVIGYDDISFYRKVSSQLGFDFLKFYIDGNVIDQWAGLVDWAKVSYQVSPGVHTFKWAFEKDAQISQGFDCGWIDYIVFPSCNLDDSLHVLANAFPGGYCASGLSQLGAYTVGGVGNITFTWTPSQDLNDPTSQFPLASPDSTTLYTVQAEDGQGMVYSPVQVTVDQIPLTPLIVQQGDSLISSAVQGNQWYDSGGPIEGASGQVYYPMVQDTFYTIITTEFGCISEPSNSIYFLFSGLDENQSREGIIVFPNPAEDALCVAFSGYAGRSIYIGLTNLTGQMVINMRHDNLCEGEIIKTDIGNLNKGIYILTIKDWNGSLLLAKKVIRE
jgi:hypothetical protein